MIRQSMDRGESEKQAYNDTNERWRQVVEGWENPTGNFPNEYDLDPADFFEPQDLPT